MAEVELTRLYRAVSLDEFNDIRHRRRFRTIPGMMEGKWFADNDEVAKLHADALYPDGDGFIVAGDIESKHLTRLFRARNLDGFGPATYLEQGDLDLIAPIL